MLDLSLKEIGELVTAVKVERSAWRTFCIEAKVDTSIENNRLRILNVVLCKLLAEFTKKEEALKLSKKGKIADLVEQRVAFDARWADVFKEQAPGALMPGTSICKNCNRNICGEFWQRCQDCIDDTAYAAFTD